MASGEPRGVVCLSNVRTRETVLTRAQPCSAGNARPPLRRTSSQKVWNEKSERETMEQEEAHEEPVDDGRRRRKRRDSADVGGRVFDESIMTLDDRRKLRRQQRDLNHAVANDEDRGEDEDAMAFLDRKRGDNNNLFEKVLFTREAVLDAENTELIAAKTLQCIDRLVQVGVGDVGFSHFSHDVFHYYLSYI